MILRFCLCLIALLWINELSAQILLSEDTPSQNIGKLVYVFEDKTGTFNINQVSSKDFEDKFKLSEQEAFNAGMSSSTFWLRLDLKTNNPKIRDWLLYSSYTFLDEATLYQKDEKENWKSISLGIEQKFENRLIKHRYIIFPFALQDTLSHRFFIKIQSQTPIQFPLQIERGSFFAEPSRTLELFYGIFIGITSLMLVGSFFYWVYFKDKEYLYYCIFLLGAMIFYLSLSGHLFQFLWRDNGYTGKLFLGVGIGIWIIGAGLFTKNFLQTFRYFPLATRLMNIYVGLGIWVIFSLFFLPYRIFTIQIILIGNLGNLLITYIGIVCWYRGNPFAKYFAIAWIFYVTGTSLLALSVTGILPRNFLTAHLGEISCVFEVIMFALALSYKNRIKHEKVRQDRLKSQQKLIEMQRSNTERLERKVAERTQEVEVQNEELKQQREELEASRNQLAEQNKVIELQNFELKQYSENLEQIVDERTQQLKQANLELASQNTQLEQFAFITAHNLRSPVAQLLGLTSLFNQQNLADPFNREIINHILSSTQAMQQTLQDLNEILEIKKGKNQNLEKLSLEEITREVIKDNFMHHKEALITYNFSEVTELYFVKAYLKSIFYNFISNAIKYKHPQRDPIVEIYTQSSKNEICLSFKDNGIGIDLKKYRHKLFGLYQRFHLEKEGKGMGLYLCKTQIEALGGRIEVQSEVGKGTRFDIYFKKMETEEE
jgi:signal transduction histidine kinase